MATTKHLVPVVHKLTAEDRARRYGHSGGVIWMTGFSASGKSTLAMALEQRLMGLGYACYVLDGDNVRNGLNANLGFSPDDRRENIRRVGEVAALFADAGLLCITAFISPYAEDRLMARNACRKPFHEVHVAANLEICESRDPKGLYRKARSGELRDFTGVSAPYEMPDRCELTLETSDNSIEICLDVLVSYVQRHFLLVSGYFGNNLLPHE